MEIPDLLSLDLLDLIVRHEVSALDALKWVKFALLLDHELVNLVDENETIIAGGNEEPLIVRQFSCRDGTNFAVVLLDRQVGLGVRAVRDANLTVCQADVQQIAKVVVRDVTDRGLFWHLEGCEGPL